MRARVLVEVFYTPVDANGKATVATACTYEDSGDSREVVMVSNTRRTDANAKSMQQNIRVSET